MDNSVNLQKSTCAMAVGGHYGGIFAGEKPHSLGRSHSLLILLRYPQITGTIIWGLFEAF